MSSRPFDTLETARDLEATGIERPQAEAIAQAIGRNGEQLATRSDFERLEAATRSDFERFEAATRSDFERFEAATRSDFERLEAATRSDFERLEAQAATKSDLERLEAKAATKSDLERLRAELYRALWIQGGGIVAIVAALKFLP